MSERYGWTGHNFPSEGYGKNSGASVTWLRRINGKRFMFTAWMRGQGDVVTSIQVMDVTGPRENWHTRHMFVS